MRLCPPFAAMIFILHGQKSQKESKVARGGFQTHVMHAVALAVDGGVHPVVVQVQLLRARDQAQPANKRARSFTGPRLLMSLAF